MRRDAKQMLAVRSSSSVWAISGSEHGSQNMNLRLWRYRKTLSLYCKYLHDEKDCSQPADFFLMSTSDDRMAILLFVTMEMKSTSYPGIMLVSPLAAMSIATLVISSRLSSGRPRSNGQRISTIHSAQTSRAGVPGWAGLDVDWQEVGMHENPSDHPTVPIILLPIILTYQALCCQDGR